MAFTIDGIVSGFDTSTIIESLLGFQQTQLDTFNARKAEITTQQSAFKGIEAQLLTMQNTLGRLNRSASSVFDVQQAVSSDEDILTAAASSSAANGTYRLTVDQLATAHQIGSQGFDSSSAEIATGEISFKVGDRVEQTITIDENNNTLAGLATTINEELDDVTASVIYDQGADSYRLLLTSKHTGTANEVNVSSNFDVGSGTEPDFSGEPIQAATDALITLGSGAGAITASYSTNQVEGLIENVTLDLTSADPDKPVTIQVSSDSTSAKEAIGDFVNEFNAIMEFIDNQTQYLPDTDQASPLLGNRSVNEIRDELRQVAIDTVPGLEGGANRLAAIGIEINTQGRLQIDSAQLDKAFSGEIEGIEPNEIRNLFGLNGTSNNAGIEFVAGSSRTVAPDSSIEVNITQAAEQASITGEGTLASSVVIDSDNNEFQITLDGVVSETLTLEEGTYTQEELASHLQSTIKNSSELGTRGVQVSVTEGGDLQIVSDKYGNSSKLSSISGPAASALGFTGAESDVGQNVAGEFIIDGVVEAATGNGRVLVGDSDNEYSADLQVSVSLAADQINAGSEGELTVTRGVSGQLDQLVSKFLDTDNGTLKGIDDAFELRLLDIDESIANVEEITESKRAYLVAEFTALESIINELRTTGDFLTQQLSTISSSSDD
ncbi:flagellar filament capping protein FliD [Mariniblastus fucicola]|uniref:Flagellar hook-associated protein 2 n=1 Tax=Mariniblastus fucicola TaxID=980251 RepID=A0A5B9PM31_9BACT|nr:flagellar filament capping protein FliD [Mariniblastus fucicola]QEG23353.1 Flagellar hook-associated protein 2 [Mariniblastus fucicola]